MHFLYMAVWEQAGVIDTETRSRIERFELGGLGALTVGIGLVSLVASNWEHIGKVASSAWISRSVLCSLPGCGRRSHPRSQAASRTGVLDVHPKLLVVAVALPLVTVAVGVIRAELHLARSRKWEFRGARSGGRSPRDRVPQVDALVVDGERLEKTRR